MAVKLGKKTAAKSAAAKKKTAPAAKPTTAKAGSGLKLRALNPADIASAFKDTERAAGGPKTNYLKFKVGKTKIRIVPVQIAGQNGPWLFLRANSLKKKEDKYPRTMLSYEWITNDPLITENILGHSKVTANDIALFNKFGDPAIEVAAKAKKADVKTKRSLWPQSKYLFVVVNRADNGVYVYEAGQKFVDQLRAWVIGDPTEGEEADYPNLLDPQKGNDIIVRATGEGLDRRYTFEVAPATTSLELAEDTELPDLWAVARRYAVPYAQKATAVFEQESEVAKALGLGPEDFGVAGSSVAFEEDDDEEEDDDD